MKIIKLNAIDSTNSYLIALAKDKGLEDETIVVAKTQSKGRGQLGAVWQTTPLQSLALSIFKKFTNLSVAKITNITFAVSIGVHKALKELQISDLHVKWPNDIMSHSKKIAGILIENQLKQSQVVSTVIGIGLNVNQEKFDSLPQATSMLLVSGTKYNLDEVLFVISKAVLYELQKVESDIDTTLKETYEALLFRKDEVSVFETNHGLRFNGIIKGVCNEGELLIENEDEALVNYKLKEIKLLF